MANSALYVKLDKETYDWLRRLSAEERRSPGDQAAMLLRQIYQSKRSESIEQAA